MVFIDKKFQKPRVWSNRELKKFAHLFQGRVINVSAWKDEDKEGKKYQEYFTNATEYLVSNFDTGIRGFQNKKNELFIDLEKSLDKKLVNKFDVVLCHTVLEHIFDVKTAFKNLCLLSKDIVILIVPFIQEIHDIDYGDFWRFTPLSIKKFFENNGLSLQYLSANEKNSSIYLFAIGTKNQKNWAKTIPKKFKIKSKKRLAEGCQYYLGTNIIKNNIFFKLKILLKNLKK